MTARFPLRAEGEPTVASPHRMRLAALFCAAALVATSCHPTDHPSASAPAPASVPVLVPDSAPVPVPLPTPFDSRSLDLAITSAIAHHDVAGAVVVVVDRDHILFEKAYGARAIDPSREDMTLDTVFDLASLTKPLATASAILSLAESGAIDLNAPATSYLPELSTGNATVSDLLLHISGLPVDAELGSDPGSRESSLKMALAVKPIDPPRQVFRYSDLGYIALGAIVERLSKERLDTFVSHRLYQPLGMSSTMFAPPLSLVPSIAPTERRAGVMLRGTVHDPRAARLQGVAGHAGLFSNAEDVSRFARMLLRGGELDGTRVFSEKTAQLMLEAHVVPGGKRALGWDVHTGFSHPRGDVFGNNGVGHTGFTGTSLWIDRESGIGVVVLASRLHPDGKGDAKSLRSQVAIAVAHAVRGDARSGIDVLEDHAFHELAHQKLAVLTNDAARDSRGKRSLDVLAEGADVRVVLAAEHGLSVDRAGPGVAAKDELTHVPIVDAYGDSLGSLSTKLVGIDTVVVDLPDCGARFFTYAATAANVANVAEKAGLRVVVLDRENPLGTATEGPLPDSPGTSLVSFFPVPIRHGKTLGELLALSSHVEVIAREPGTSLLPLVGRLGKPQPPSPNLRSGRAMLLYPGVALVELTNVSVGRGTDAPFERIGAPWIDARVLARALKELAVAGIQVSELDFTPRVGPFAGELCHGVQLFVDDPSSFRPVRFGIALVIALQRSFPGVFKPDNVNVLLSHRATYDAILRGESLDSIVARWTKSDVSH